MKKQILTCLAAALLLSMPAAARQYAEKLNRGAVKMQGAARGGAYLSWRSFVTDSKDMTFDIYRNGTKVANVSKTNYKNLSYKVTDKFVIKAVVNGEVVEEFSPMQIASSKKLHIDRPAGGKTKPYTTTVGGNTESYPDGQAYTYEPNDCSVGDVDGDGEYELIVKWYPSNARDNSQNGVTGNTILDCYKLDGTKLWRIDLGKNIRSGAHYTQFLVYDFDGDGKAEMICKTAPGSIDGAGAYVSEAATEASIKSVNNTKDWVTSAGRVDGGQEWLTVFNGETGKAVHTIYYNPNRNTTVGGEAAGTFNWDDRSGKNDKGSYGNRGERYLAAVAALGGPDALPSAVMCRGYYTYAFLWAVDFDGKELKTRWLHSSKSTTSYTVMDAAGTTNTYKPGAATRGSGSRTAYGNGNHNMSVADVDGDGKDEIVWGSCAIDDDGKLLYATGYGHGDAIHVGKMIPSREGLQVYQVHEASPYGWDLHDAATGEIILSGTADGDTGRGIAADIDANNDGWEMWCSSSSNPRNAVTGKTISFTAQPSMNFRIYWDGDLQDELLDGSTITKYSNGAVSTLKSLSGSSCNGSKKTPNLLADILGDWREEVILWDSSTSSDLHIHSTTEESDHRVPCLMQDHTYRMAVAWQNGAYNQPPHLGYYLPDYEQQYVQTAIGSPVISGECEITVCNPAGTMLKKGYGTVEDMLDTLPTGMYVIKANDGTHTNTRKFIVR